MNKGCKGPLQRELQTIVQGNKRGHIQMEKHSMLMVRKNQYCENGPAAQSNLQLQHYPHQATYDPLHKTRKKHLKFYMDTTKSPYSQDNCKQKEQIWSHHTV